MHCLQSTESPKGTARYHASHEYKSDAPRWCAGWLLSARQRSTVLGIGLRSWQGFLRQGKREAACDAPSHEWRDAYLHAIASAPGGRREQGRRLQHPMGIRVASDGFRWGSRTILLRCDGRGRLDIESHQRWLSEARGGAARFDGGPAVRHALPVRRGRRRTSLPKGTRVCKMSTWQRAPGQASSPSRWTTITRKA